MHLRQIKTLLILSFFVLYLYLFMQFMDKKEEADIAILEEQTSTIEDQLKSEDISVVNLPKEDDEETYISVKQENFEEDDLEDESLENKQDPTIYKYNLITSKLYKQINIRENKEKTYISIKKKKFEEYELEDESKENKQDTNIYKYNLIASKLDKQIKIKENASTDTLTEILEETVFYPEEYTFWNWNRDANIIIFFQNKMDRPVYYNQNGIVLFYLNDDNEVEYYTQTMLGEEEEVSEKQSLIDPMH